MVLELGSVRYDLSSRTHIMGILNVTPDSFSDGGRFLDRDRAVEHGLRMTEEGADIIDVGGESTRPRGSAYGAGAQPVAEEEELRRVIPVIEALRARTATPLSVDTTKSRVAREALAAGVAMVNDVGGFRFDPAMADVVGAAGAAAVVMHTPSRPEQMPTETPYTDLVGEVTAFLAESVRLGRHAGIRQIIVDPGLGFGKRRADNYRLIACLGKLRALGCPVLVGPSRKAFLGSLLDLPVDQRLEATLAAVTACILAGAHLVRVHDVREVRRAAAVADEVRRAAAC